MVEQFHGERLEGGPERRRLAHVLRSGPRIAGRMVMDQYQRLSLQFKG